VTSTARARLMSRSCRSPTNPPHDFHRSIRTQRLRTGLTGSAGSYLVSRGRAWSPCVGRCNRPPRRGSRLQFLRSHPQPCLPAWPGWDRYRTLGLR
jgi:hypothetical protein